MMKTAVALYSRFEQARTAVEALLAGGIPRDHLGLFVNDQAGTYRQALHHHLTEETSEEPAKEAAKGGGIGAFLGGLVGVEAATVALAVLGAPVLVLGGVGVLLVGAGIGAATGGLLAALTEVRVAQEEARFYEAAVQQGGSLVVVTVEEERLPQVEAILAAHDPVNLDERLEVWKQSGQTGLEADAPPNAALPPTPPSDVSAL